MRTLLLSILLSATMVAQDYTFADFVGTWNGNITSDLTFGYDDPITIVIQPNGDYSVPYNPGGHLISSLYHGSEEILFNPSTNIITFRWINYYHYACGGACYSSVPMQVMDYSNGDLTLHYNNGSGPAPQAVSAFLSLDGWMPALPGDMNADGSLDVTDIVQIVNCILGESSGSCENGDVNQDGILNILDVITVINQILGRENSAAGATEAIIEVNDGTFVIESNGGIAGVQLRVGGDFVISNIEISSGWVYRRNAGTLLFYSTDGSILEDGRLFSYSGDLIIEEMIVGNSSGEAVNTDLLTTAGSFHLAPAYPNPFNPSTQISYSLASDAAVRLVVYDISGREMDVLVNETRASGEHQVSWQAAGYPSGTYLVVMQAGNEVQTRKIVLLK